MHVLYMHIELIYTYKIYVYGLLEGGGGLYKKKVIGYFVTGSLCPLLTVAHSANDKCASRYNILLCHMGPRICSSA